MRQVTAYARNGIILSDEEVMLDELDAYLDEIGCIPGVSDIVVDYPR